MKKSVYARMCICKTEKKAESVDRQTKNNSSHIVYLIRRISIELGIVPWTSSSEVIKNDSNSTASCSLSHFHCVTGTRNTSLHCQLQTGYILLLSSLSYNAFSEYRKSDWYPLGKTSLLKCSITLQYTKM